MDGFVFRFNQRCTPHAAFDTLLRIGARNFSSFLPLADLL